MSGFLEAVRAAGVVGQGGAGFPSHVKYAAKVETVIANGCECEPLLATDQHLMTAYPGLLAKGLSALAGQCGASRAVIAVKAKHAGACRAMREIAGSGIELAELDDFYPAGDEHVLVREITGRSIPALGLPKDVGALVANVGTLISAARALDGIPVTVKALTVAGAVVRPSVVEAPLGASFGLCLDYCGGAAIADPVFLLGGPMMGRFVESRTELEALAVTKTSGALLVLPRGGHLHNCASLDLKSIRNQAASACIQCRYCTDLCPRHLAGHPFSTHQVMRAFAANDDLGQAARQAMLCSECGVCELYACPMRLSPRRVNAWLKQRLREEKLVYEGGRAIVEAQTAMRGWRKVSGARLAQRIGLGGYAKAHPEFAGHVEAKSLSLPLRQHLGAPAVPVVAAGERVAAGQLVAEMPEGALGARLHSPLDGVVASLGSAVNIEGV